MLRGLQFAATIYLSHLLVFSNAALAQAGVEEPVDYTAFFTTVGAIVVAAVFLAVRASIKKRQEQERVRELMQELRDD